MNNKELILIGGGGHCKMIISQLKKINRFEIIGIIDKYKPIGSRVLDVEIIGKDEDLKSLYERGIRYALITLGSVKDNLKRQSLFDLAKKLGYEFPILIGPGTLIDKDVKIDAGTVILPGSIINVGSTIGKNCILNSGSIIEHDCQIGNHCHIAPGAHLSGGVEIGDLSFVGIGSTIIQGIKIGKNVTIGAGSVVIRDIPENTIVVGNPAKIIKHKDA